MGGAIIPQINIPRVFLESDSNACTPRLTPRLVPKGKSGRFVIQPYQNKDPEGLLYLAMNLDGKLEIIRNMEKEAVWIVHYMNLEWPIQYFRLYNSSAHRYLYSEHTADDDRGLPKGELKTVPKYMYNKKCFDKGFSFYLSPPDSLSTENNVFIVNTMFGPCLKLDSALKNKSEVKILKPKIATESGTDSGHQTESSVVTLAVPEEEMRSEDPSTLWRIVQVHSHPADVM